MPIVPSAFTLLQEESDVTLALYALAVQAVPENIFWGVRRTDDPEYECDTYFIKPERDMLLRALAEAQIEIEQETGFPLRRRWIEDESRPYSFPVFSLWAQVFDGGIRATDTIEADAAVTHNADDANGNPVDSTVTVNTTVTDVDEVRVYYPASLNVEGPVEIDPSDIDISGGIATIRIPRWRMVTPALVSNPRGGIDYDTAGNFLSVVDVMRVYNDDSTEAVLAWPHQDSACGCCDICCPTCSEFTHTGCIYVKNPVLGVLDVLPATYSAGTWSAVNSSCFCETPTIIRLNYRAGPETLSIQARDAVIRLAHTKMPDEPCGCDVVQRMWKRDRNIPDALTRERVNCRFGQMDGAWAAWQFSQAMKVVRGGVI